MNLQIATLLLIVSAVTVGFYLVFIGLRHRRRAPGLGLTHASLALSCITLLFIQIFTGPENKLNNLASLQMLEGSKLKPRIIAWSESYTLF